MARKKAAEAKKPKKAKPSVEIKTLEEAPSVEFKHTADVTEEPAKISRPEQKAIEKISKQEQQEEAKEEIAAEAPEGNVAVTETRAELITKETQTGFEAFIIILSNLVLGLVAIAFLTIGSMLFLHNWMTKAVAVIFLLIPALSLAFSLKGKTTRIVVGVIFAAILSIFAYLFRGIVAAGKIQVDEALKGATGKAALLAQSYIEPLTAGFLIIVIVVVYVLAAVIKRK